MSIITLTTDYGNKDYFVSSLKAKRKFRIKNNTKPPTAALLFAATNGKNKDIRKLLQ